MKNKPEKNNPKMIQLNFNDMYRGFQLPIVYVCKTKAEATKLLDVSLHFINTWCGISKEPYPDLKPYQKYVDMGNITGEITYFIDRKAYKGKYLPMQQIIDKITDHRKICSNYNETVKWADKKVKSEQRKVKSEKL